MKAQGCCAAPFTNSVGAAAYHRLDSPSCRDALLTLLDHAHIYIYVSMYSTPCRKSRSSAICSVLFIRHSAVSLELSFFMAITTSKGHTVSTLRELISRLDVISVLHFHMFMTTRAL